MQFGLVAMGSALRGIGLFKPGMVVQTVTVGINLVLAPALMFGWGTGYPMGVAGTAAASLVSIVVGTVWLAAYFVRPDAFLQFHRAEWTPRLSIWRELLAIGVPAGAEFALTGVYVILVYVLSRPFGAAAQAGFGIGLRLIQSLFLPVVALGFAVAPVAGQNVGAGQAARVRETFRLAASLAGGMMLVMTLACQIAPAALIRPFSGDAEVIAVGEEYLRISSWNLVASGIIFVSSSLFQALGRTLPALATSAGGVLAIAIPAFLLSRLPGFGLLWIWYLSVAAVTLQMAAPLVLLRREMRLRLGP